MLDLEEVREWIKKAEDDFEGALHLLRRRKKHLPDLVCFHFVSQSTLHTIVQRQNHASQKGRSHLRPQPPE